MTGMKQFLDEQEAYLKHLQVQVTECMQSIEVRDTADDKFWYVFQRSSGVIKPGNIAQSIIAELGVRIVAITDALEAIERARKVLLGD